MVNQSQKASYATGGSNIDDAAYNPDATSNRDGGAFAPERDDQFQPVGARGAGHQPTARDFSKEDREAERSELSGKIPQGMCLPSMYDHVGSIVVAITRRDQRHS